jgi:HlyD family secretion protein
MRAKKTLYVIGLFGALTGLGAWALLKGQGGIQYRTVPVQRGDIEYTISATGNPNAVVTVQVGSQVSGNIMALYADFNSKVTKGQLIARIDPSPLQAKVDQAQANVQAAQANAISAQANVQKALASVQAANAAVANARAGVVKAQAAANDAKIKAERRVTLAKEGVLSKEDMETAMQGASSAAADVEAEQAQVKAAEDNVKVAQAEVEAAKTQMSATQAQVKQAQASLHAAQIDLDNTFIKAPVDGVVVSRNVDVGQTVAASLAAPTLFQIAQDLTKMQVDTNVSEADVGRVKVGQAASFTVDAYPGRVFRGAVTAVRQAPINVQNVITYDVVVGVSNPDLKLFPGMTANVKIMIDQRQDVLKVPNAALRYRPATQQPVRAKTGRKGGGVPEQAVWVLDENGRPRRVKVTIGETDGSFTEIASGDLKQGDPVIVAAMSKEEKKPSGSAFGPQGGGRRGGF